MIFTEENRAPKFALFPAKTAIEIIDHASVDRETIFTYLIPIEINQSLIGRLDGDLQVRGYLGQKRQESVIVKKSLVVGGNILRNINRQRSKQISDRKYEKKFFIKKFIDRPDLTQARINFEIKFKSSSINDLFILEITNIKSDGSESLVDTIEIDHNYALRRYDLPSQDFILTTTRTTSTRIYASAVSTDPVVQGFKFYLKNKSNPTFLLEKFENLQEIPINSSNESTAIFDVPDCDQSYSIMARPITRFFKQEIGNFRQDSAGFIENVKYLPFYLEKLTNSKAFFRLQGLDLSIKKILFYKQILPGGERILVDILENPQGNVVLGDLYRNAQYDVLYTIDYVNSSGIYYESPAEVVVPALKLDSLASISVNLVSSIDDINRTQSIEFNANVSYKTSTIVDQITQDLKKLGLENLLSSELEKTTNNLKPLIRILVTNISLTTGIESDVGIYEPGLIQIPFDNTISEKSVYRFEVAVRSVPEALENITAAQNLISSNAFNLRSEVDLSSKLIGNKTKTGRTSYSAKFFTKNAIKGSLLRYGDASSLGDLTFYTGRTGIFSDIQIDTEQITPVNITNISFFSTRKGNYVTWMFIGSTESIDYFEIDADGTIFLSKPTDNSTQIFHLGNVAPSRIEITPITYGRKGESSTGIIEVA